MSWTLFVLDRTTPVATDLDGGPSAELRLDDRVFREVRDLDTEVLFYDFIVDSGGRIAALQLQVPPEHPVAAFVTARSEASTPSYVEFCPLLRIWLSATRGGHEQGLEAFGDIRFFRDQDAVPAIAVDPESWLGQNGA